MTNTELSNTIKHQLKLCHMFDMANELDYITRKHIEYVLLNELEVMGK